MPSASLSAWMDGCERISTRKRWANEAEKYGRKRSAWRTRRTLADAGHCIARSLRSCQALRRTDPYERLLVFPIYSAKRLAHIALVKSTHSQDQLSQPESHAASTAHPINEFTLMSRIAARSSAMARDYGVEYDYTTALMDIEAAHEHCPIRLLALLNADDGNFGHDVFGIRRHLDRTTRTLGDCFSPRFAK